MKIALDPYMHRHVPLLELPRFVADLGYEYIELSPRADFLNWWVHPRVFPERTKAFKKALKDAGVKLATLLPMYRWASPIEAERQVAVKNWKAAIQVAVEMGCDTMNSEFGRGPSPDVPSHCSCCAGAFTEACEAAWFRSMEELVPILEKEGIQLNIEPHPEDFVETLQPAVDMIRVINSKNVRFLYCAPHTFYFGDDIQAMIREAAPVLAHVHIADTFNHKASSGLRYIINPPGSKATVHQHLNIGQGEVDWDVFFGTLHEVGFDGIMTACVFAWEEKAEESSRFMLKEINRYIDKYWDCAAGNRRHEGEHSMTVNVGVIGVGMIGQDHIRRLTKVLAGASVTAVSDVDLSRAKGVAEGIGNARAFATGEEMIVDSKVDAVVVTSWGPTHEQYVLACIAAGKPVFCEKPLATTQEACLRILDAEMKFGRRLVQVGFMRRYDPAYRAMKEVVTSGAIGAPLMMHASHRNPDVPGHYTADMAINDTAVHDVDVARWLLDDEVIATSVLAPRRNRHAGDLRDPLFVLFEMSSGAIVDIEVSVNIQYGYEFAAKSSGRMARSNSPKAIQ